MPLTRNGKNYGTNGVADGDAVSAASSSDTMKRRSITIDFFAGADGHLGACKYSAKCPSCLPEEVTFNTIQEWRSHHESHHHSDAGYQCPKCRCVSQNWYNYTNHVQTHDDIASAWRCNLDGCKLPFANIYSLLTHWKKNHTQYIIKNIPSKSGMVRTLNESPNDSESEQSKTSKNRGAGAGAGAGAGGGHGKTKRKYKHLHSSSSSNGGNNRKRRKLQLDSRETETSSGAGADSGDGDKKRNGKKSRKRHRHRRERGQHCGQRRIMDDESESESDFLAAGTTDFDDVSNVSAPSRDDDSTIFTTTEDDEDDDLERLLQTHGNDGGEIIQSANSFNGIDLLLRAANIIDSAQSVNAEDYYCEQVDGIKKEEKDFSGDEEHSGGDNQHAQVKECKPPIFLPKDHGQYNHHDDSSKPGALLQTKLPSLTTFGSNSSTKQENQILAELCSSMPTMAPSPQLSHNATTTTTTTSCSSSAMNDTNSTNNTIHFPSNEFQILHQQNNMHNMLQITPNITTTTPLSLAPATNMNMSAAAASHSGGNGKVCIVPVQWEMLQHLQHFNTQYSHPSNVINVNNNIMAPQSQLAYIHPNHNKSMISVTLIPQQHHPHMQPFSFQNTAAVNPVFTPVQVGAFNVNGGTPVPYLHPNFNHINPMAPTPSVYVQNGALPQSRSQNNHNNSSVLPLPDLPTDFLNQQNRI